MMIEKIKLTFIITDTLDHHLNLVRNKGVNICFPYKYFLGVIESALVKDKMKHK